MMQYEPHGKMREPNRRRAKKMNEEDLEPKGFFEKFNEKHVRVKLVTNDVFEGVLETNSYNKYDCLLLQGKPILLPKHAIVFVEEMKKEKQNEPNQ